jgi:hypothetical protein
MTVEAPARKMRGLRKSGPVWTGRVSSSDDCGPAFEIGQNAPRLELHRGPMPIQWPIAKAWLAAGSLGGVMLALGLSPWIASGHPLQVLAAIPLTVAGAVVFVTLLGLCWSNPEED